MAFLEALRTPQDPQTTNVGGGDWFSANAPTSTAPTAGTAPMGGGSTMTQDQLVQLVGNRWNDTAYLQSILPQLKAAGIQVQNDVPGRGDLRPRFMMPDGTTIDIGDQGVINRGNIGNWANPGAGGSGGGYGGFGGMVFNAPSLEDARNSPGYQFALEQGMKAIQNSAASKGTLLTGGTLKALQGYGTGLADQTYQAAFDRAKAVHDTRFGNLYDVSRLGLPQ